MARDNIALKCVFVLLLVASGLAWPRLVNYAAMTAEGGSITKADFGKTADGPVDIYTLRNAQGAEARIMTHGGIVVSLKMPDKNGKMDDVVLGFDTLDGYLNNSDPFFGCLVGRYGNRIAKGEFKLGDKTYSLAKNNGPNHLHGGLKGFDKVNWKAQPIESAGGPSLELSYTSADGEEGYPGELKVTAVYTLTNDNALKVAFTASTNMDTHCNLTHHSYFNLAGKGNILDHEIQIEADKTTPVDDTLIPTGKLQPVDGTPFDFRKSTKIGARIDAADEQIKFGGGYDHNWVLNHPAGQLGKAATVYEPMTGRVLEVFTTEPGLQFYSGNFLTEMTGKGGRTYNRRDGFCLEPQHFPDTPNQPTFPSTLLKPGQTYRNTIVYKFSTR